MQDAMVDYIRNGDRPDQILILEHNPVFTMGRSASGADIHLTEEFLSRNGLEVHRINRGGQVTYHGPGQIVVYPVCSLRGGGRQSVSRFVNALEQAMIETARDFGVCAERIDGYPGIWVKTKRGPEKLGAVGIHLKKWISTHGIAFNLAPDMSHFQQITPCGISELGVCSLGTILGEECPTWYEASESLADHLTETLAIEAMPVENLSQSISATVWRYGTNGPEILMMLRCPSEGKWWSSVTGMVEAGEVPEAAAHRETMEETGLRGKLVPLDFKHTFWIDPALAHNHLEKSGELAEPCFNAETCFQMEVPAGSQVVLNSAEHSEYRWCTPDEALSLIQWDGSRTALKTLISNYWE